MRKLGFKNIFLFFVMAILSFFIILIFVVAIKHMSSMDNHVYKLAEGSLIYTDEFLPIEVGKNSNLKKSFDTNYYLTTIEDNIPVKNKIGKSVVVYHPSDYKMYLYGTFYLVRNNGEIEKIEKKAEVTRTLSSSFYKISDRKYLWIDKSISSSDGSIKTKNYLIIELDKQGNATLANQEINEKTINPIILKGTEYDFDVVHEKLIINKEEIDLKNIIGSSNLYKDPENTEKGDKNQDKGEQNQKEENYYDEYLEKLVDHFNALKSGVIEANDALNNKNTDTNVNSHLDISRWISLGTIESMTTSVKVNYNVFDPSNEYSSIFLILTDSSGESKKFYLNKENNYYIVRGLSPNNEYTITLMYQLAISIDPSGSEISSDTVKVKTKKPEYQLQISKITSNQIYFYLKMDDEYQVESGNIILLSDDVQVANLAIDVEQAKKGYTASFPYEKLGYSVEIRLQDLVFNGQKVELDVFNKYINR